MVFARPRRSATTPSAMPPRPQARSLLARIKPPVYATSLASEEPINSLTQGTSTSVKIVRSIASNIHVRQADANESQRIPALCPLRRWEAAGSSAVMFASCYPSEGSRSAHPDHGHARRAWTGGNRVWTRVNSWYLARGPRRTFRAGALAMLHQPEAPSSFRFSIRDVPIRERRDAVCELRERGLLPIDVAGQQSATRHRQMGSAWRRHHVGGTLRSAT